MSQYKFDLEIKHIIQNMEATKIVPVSNEPIDPKWHYCDVAEDVKLGFKDGQCIYKTKNRDAMRVHLRTLHSIYYCGYCRQRWYGIMGQKQMWKRHMEKDCRQHPEIRGKK